MFDVFVDCDFVFVVGLIEGSILLVSVVILLFGFFGFVMDLVGFFGVIFVIGLFMLVSKDEIVVLVLCVMWVVLVVILVMICE